MTWTYDEAPGSETAAERRDAVRILVGDTDTTDQQISDEAIAYFLEEAGDRVYVAAASTARSIAASYARLVTNSIDAVSVNLSDRMAQYEKLAIKLDREAKSKGAGLGLARAGGISEDAMRTADDDSDRPDPAFRSREFRNPGRFKSDDYDEV